jgi:hypothetical protein
MSKRIPTGITKEFLQGVSLPSHGGRYTPISHKSIIDTTMSQLQANNLTIKAELYRSTLNGNIANGIILIDHGSELDFKMVLAWGNSYDKSTRFTCGIGAYIMSTKTFIFAGDLSNFARKHTGTADQEAIEKIKEQISNADSYYNLLVQTKKELESLTLTDRQIAEAIGRLFIEKNILTKEQVGGIYDMIRTKQVLFQDTSFNNAWNIYNIIAKYLRESHPKVWFQSQCAVHRFFMKDLLKDITEEVIVVEEPVGNDSHPVSNQLDLLDAIAEAEAAMDDSIPEIISEEVQEILDVEAVLEDDTLTGKADPDEFFALKSSNEESFELPDL